MNLSVNTIKLNYIQQGKGKPVLLLHGNGEDHHIFDELAKKMKNDFSLYAIDSRNHGESTKTPDHSYETMAEDIFQLITKLNLKNVSVLGFSDGAIISLLLSLQHPGIFSKMILSGINLKPTSFKKEIYEYIQEDYKKNNDPLLKMMLEQPNIELKDLEKVQTPVLLTAGEDDLFYEKTFYDMVKALPDATLKIMQGHDHGSYIINQDILYPEVKNFLI